MAIDQGLYLRRTAPLAVRDVRRAGFAEEAVMAEPTLRGSGIEEGRRSVNIWIDRWQRGIDPEESFRRIFRHYYPLVRSFFARHGFSEQEIEDLAQETFLRVYRKLDGFRGDSQFETWLFQVTNNVYKNELRSRAAQKRDAKEVAFEEVEDPAGAEAGVSLTAADSDALDGMLTSERAEVLHRAMADLPPQMRRCVELRVYWDLKYKEIAVLMGVSIDTVKAHLFQARLQLRNKLGSYFAEPRFGDSIV
jgi:RNA polymerase sigma-70 factor (ECF subfamily)